MLVSILHGGVAGSREVLPTCVSILAVVFFQNGVFFIECLNGTQVDLAFLHGIIAYKLAVPESICKLISLVLICGNVFGWICRTCCFVEQRIQIALCCTSCCAEL